MYNIFCLTSDISLAEIPMDVAFILTKGTLENICFANKDCDGVKLSLKSILERLDKVKKSSKKWTYQNIFQKLKQTCFSPARESHPDFNQGAEKIAGHFQVRKNSIINTKQPK